MKMWKYGLAVRRLDLTDCEEGDEVFVPTYQQRLKGVLEVEHLTEAKTVNIVEKKLPCLIRNGEHLVTIYSLDDTWHQSVVHCPCDYRPYDKNPVLKITITRRPTMANKLLAALKLNKTQRKLVKAGVYDSNGNLTEDGKELVLNYLAGENEAKLVDLTKDLVSKSKKESD